MTNYQASAIRNNYGWRQNRTLSQKIEDVKKIGVVSRTVFAIIVVLILGLVHVSQATKAGSMAVPISNMEKKVSDLLEKNQSLSSDVARMQSLSQLEDSATAQTLSRPASVEFVQ